MSRQEWAAYPRSTSSRLAGGRGPSYHRKANRPGVEPLEVRNLLAATLMAGPIALIAEAGPNDTLDLAQDVGSAGVMPGVVIAGLIGDGPAGPADVDWYRFTLDRPASVALSAQGLGATPSLKSVLSLYNSDPFNFQDWYNPLGHRLLAQDDGGAHGGDPSIGRDLGPGTYYVANSGAGNFDFHPFIAGSGHEGGTGAYLFQITAAEIDAGVEGPIVLAADPAPDAVLAGSPFVIRLGLSGALGPSANVSQDTVRLVFNPVGTFGDSQDQDVSLLGIYSSTGANELQLTLQAPLGPGFYKIVVAGADGAEDGAGLPLARTFTSTFRIAGIEGNTGPDALADDTVSTAHPLGDLSGGNFVRIVGAIGDDPFYGPESGLAPGNDVDMYYFRISGPGRYAFVAEVFAGRIGSPLDPGVSLYRLDPSDGTLRFVAGNNNTLNPTPGTDGVSHLLFDSVLFVGLTAGDYYLAVSDGWNTPSPREGSLPGSEGLFDPNFSHSGQYGFGTGSYVLNVQARLDSEPPRVVSASPSRGATLDQPPTHLVVQFSEEVNVQELASRGAQHLAAAIFIKRHDGVVYFPQLTSYDHTTHTATFLMLDGLANGEYELHLSGANGLADLFGNPLAGDDPGGDHVLRFKVQGPDRGLKGNPTDGYSLDAQPGVDTPQDLGVLFSHEVQAGVTLRRGLASNGVDPLAPVEEVYQFRLLQGQSFFFRLDGPRLPDGARIELMDAEGNTVMTDSLESGRLLFGQLEPGIYSIRVVGWTSGESAGVEYELRIFAFESGDNPAPLFDGPAPAIRFRLDALPAHGKPDRPPPPPPPPPPPLVTVPNTDPPAGGSEPGDFIAPDLPGSPGTVVSTVTIGPMSAPASLGGGGGIGLTSAGGEIRPAGDQGASSPASLHFFPGELLVLGSGAYGGVGVGEGAASPAAETVQLVLQEPSPALSPELLQLVTLVQPGVPSEVADDPEAPDERAATSLPEILALVDESLQHLAAPVGRLLESLQDFADWWTTPPATSDQATAPLEDPSSAGASVGALEQDLPPGLAIETEAEPSEEEEPERGWLASMATLGLVAFACASRRRGGPRRGRDVVRSMPRAEDDPRAEPCPGGAEGVPGSARRPTS